MEPIAGPEVSLPKIPDWKLEQRAAEQASKAWRPLAIHTYTKDGRRAGIQFRTDQYASNTRGDLIRTAFPLTGRARRWRTRIMQRVAASLKGHPLP